MDTTATSLLFSAASASDTNVDNALRTEDGKRVYTTKEVLLMLDPDTKTYFIDLIKSFYDRYDSKRHAMKKEIVKTVQTDMKAAGQSIYNYFTTRTNAVTRLVKELDKYCKNINMDDPSRKFITGTLSYNLYRQFEMPEELQEI